MSENDASSKGPSFRQRFEATLGNHALALEEIVCVTVMSLLPILIGTIIGYFQSVEIGHSFSRYWRVVYHYLQNGELFLYCTAVLATVFFMASLDRATGRFPGRKWFITLSVICIGISILFFTLRRVKFPFDAEIAFAISCVVYSVSLVMYYLLVAQKHADVPRYQQVIANGERTLTKELEDRKAR